MNAPAVCNNKEEDLFNGMSSMDNEYYKTYKGPPLATITVDGETDSYAFCKIKELYGLDYNWNCNLYSFGAILTESYLDKEIKFYFESTPENGGRKHWSCSTYRKLNDVFNPPIFMPCNQKLI